MAARHSRPGARAAGTALTDRGLAPELGLEAPISAAGDQELVDRRHVSLRWLAGTVLAGLSGAALIGSAIYVSLDGELSFAERPQVALSTQTRSTEAERSERRGNRILPPPEIALAKQAFRTPTTIKVGDKEVIKIKPFVRVATNLAQSSLGFSGDIPTFNPMKLYSSGGGPVDKAAPEPEPAEGEAEVSVQRRPLLELGNPDTPFMLGEDQILAQVEEERRRSRESLPMTSQLLLSRTLPSASFAPDPGLAGPSDTEFSSIQITVVPENVTPIAKTPPSEPGSAVLVGGNEERTVTVKRGETLDQILRAQGVSTDEVPRLLAALGRKLKDGPVKEGQKLRLLVGRGPDARTPRQLLRLTIIEDERVTAIAAINDQNQFVSVAPPPSETTTVAEATPAEDDEGEDNGRGIRLYDSLYETALKNEVPPQIIEQIVKIFFYDVDLQRRVANGDGIEIFYGEDDEAEGRYELLYASLTVGNNTRRYYRYVNAEDGGIDYFDEQGKSNRKFLIRKPIAEGIQRSGFGMRYHPILRYSKMHTGVDWANRIGTPIFAAGDGVVQTAGWSSGYGRRVEIEHPYNFVTTYSHMSAFAKGVKEGARVRQGQVIGYVGSTGLSTGPHLHYEVLVNDNFVDPLSIKLPRNRELDGKQVAEFKRERDRIDELMRKAPQATRVAEKRS
jgi:murein DD-endopeptidase MepM/ murein hydrolase activator NlpD